VGAAELTAEDFDVPETPTAEQQLDDAQRAFDALRSVGVRLAAAGARLADLSAAHRAALAAGGDTAPLDADLRVATAAVVEISEHFQERACEAAGLVLALVQRLAPLVAGMERLSGELNEVMASALSIARTADDLRQLRGATPP
jgi:hypothetical protein